MEGQLGQQANPLEGPLIGKVFGSKGRWEGHEFSQCEQVAGSAVESERTGTKITPGTNYVS